MKSILIFITIFVCFNVQAHSKRPPQQHKAPEPPTEPQEFQSPFLKDVVYKGSHLKQYFQTHSVKLYDGIKKRERFFYTHLTTPAAAESSGELNYETFPGARGFDTFLLDSLSLGLWRGLQVGVIPLFYFHRSGSDGIRFTSSFTYKWNFLSLQNWDFAIGGSTLSYLQNFAGGIQDPDTGEIFYSAHNSVVWSTFMVNYFFENYPIAIGLNTSRATVQSDNDFLNKYYEQNINSQAKTEVAFDINYLLNDNWNYTVGFGRYKPTASELYHTYPGVGLTITRIRHTNWFNRISGGVHWLDGVNSWHALLSFSI
jgi:hypothetical protein